MKWINSRKIPETLVPKQGASDPISGQTGLCGYLFYPNLFLSQITIISPQKNNQNAPQKQAIFKGLYTNKPRQPSWLAFLDLDTLSFDI